MAETASSIQARIDSIQLARDSGVLVVRHGDTSTTFRTLQEMDQIISTLNDRLARVSGLGRRRIYYPWQSSKGL